MEAVNSYELLYGTGGHGGPHWGLDAATEHAVKLLLGSPTEQTVYIVPRDKRVLSHENAVRVVEKQPDQTIGHRDCA